jgi:hypothetical protein
MIYQFEQLPHLQTLRALLILELGSFAVLADVNRFFIPHIRLQKESLLLPPLGCGAPNLEPGLAAR